jgi:hypothetical protein
MGQRGGEEPLRAEQRAMCIVQPRVVGVERERGGRDLDPLGEAPGAMQRAGQLHRRRRRCRIDAIGRAIGVDRSREVTGGSAGIAQIGAEGGAGGIGQDRAVEQRDRPRRIP